MTRFLFLPLISVLACTSSHAAPDASTDGSLPDDILAQDVLTPDVRVMERDAGTPDVRVMERDTGAPDEGPGDNPVLSDLSPAEINALCGEYQPQVEEILESFDPCLMEGLQEENEAACNMTVERCRVAPPESPPTPPCEDILGPTEECGATTRELQVCLDSLVGRLGRFFSQTCADIDDPAPPLRPSTVPECRALLMACPGYF